MAANAFNETFLHRVRAQDGPPSGLAAELEGPWEVIESGGRHRVVPVDLPGGGAVATFGDRQEALLFAALLPLVGADPLYRPLAEDPTEGADVKLLARPGEEAASLVTPADDTVSALNLLGQLVRKPRSLALLLEAAGAPALEIAGEILARRIRAEDGALLDLDAIAEALGVPDGPEKRREVLAQLRELRPGGGGG